MSTLKVTNIQATGETASRAVSGVAAAWVNLNGTGTIATRDSNNVSSLTDSGTGKYDINFSNNTGNANYAYNVTCANTSTPYLRQFWVNDVANATTSKVQAQTLYASDTSGNGANSDTILVSVSIHGDLA